MPQSISRRTELPTVSAVVPSAGSIAAFLPRTPLTRMGWLVFARLCLAGFVLPARAQSEPHDMRLFLLIGQSNMAGRGPVRPQVQAANPRIFMLTRDLQWVPARDPLHFDKPKVAGVGPGSEFARAISRHEPSAAIGLIPCAVGGTSLDEWRPGGPLYTEALRRTRAAMPHGTLAGILWHQGEADSALDKVATYGDRFLAMITQLRADLGAQKVPVVMGELGRFRKNEASVAFNAALPAVVARVPLCVEVTSEDLRDKGDSLHFDADSACRLGARYAAAFLTLQARGAPTVAH